MHGQQNIVYCICRRSSYREVNTPVRLQKPTQLLLYRKNVAILKSTKNINLLSGQIVKFF